MENRDTKQAILDEALELFASRGYDGVTVADIAAAVGIKAASLYKHFDSKKDIFDSILQKASEGYIAMTAQLGLDGVIYDNDIERYVKMGVESMVQTGEAFFHYFLHDKTARSIRRMLTIEQYKDEQASQLFTAQYIDGALDYQTGLFTNFLQLGFMTDIDPDIAAIYFYAPLYLMICLCDNCPEREPEALDIIKRHMIYFRQLYMKEDKNE